MRCVLCAVGFKSRFDIFAEVTAGESWALAPRSGCGFRIELTRSGSLSLAHSGLISSTPPACENRSPKGCTDVSQAVERSDTPGRGCRPFSFLGASIQSYYIRHDLQN